MAARESNDPRKVLDFDTVVLEGVDAEAQEVLLAFIAKVVNKMPEELGLKLFDDLKHIAAACYRCKWDERPDRLN